VDSLLLALNNFMAFIPTLLGAFVLLVVGWWVSGAISRLLERALIRLGFEKAIAKTSINGFIARAGSAVTTSHVVSLLLTWMIRLIFVQAATNILGMPQMTAVINSIVLFIPKVAVAMIIFIVGSLVAGVLARVVQGSLAQSKVGNPASFGALTQYAVLGFATVAALSQLEIAPVIINSLFISWIGAIALATGLAFGLGGREVAGELTRRWFERAKEIAPGSVSGPSNPPLREATPPPRRTGT